tara:strand:- start:261 stop:452 length:192 start_codon:yes stop_codon:yes gene_type:complete
VRFFITALVLMMTLPACSTDDTNESVVITGDVSVEDVEENVDDTTDSETVDSEEDVATVEEGD